MILDAFINHPVVLSCCLWAVIGIVRAVRQAYRDWHVPGPWHARWTDAVVTLRELTDARSRWIHGLHARYGPVVLVAPGEVHVADVAIARSLYADRTVGKAGSYEEYNYAGEDNLFSTLDDASHARRRRRIGNFYARSRLPSIEDRIDAAVEGMIGEVEVFQAVAGLTLDVIAAVVLGRASPIDRHAIRQSIEDRRDRDWARLLRRRGHGLIARVVATLSSSGASGPDPIADLVQSVDKDTGGLYAILSKSAEPPAALSEVRDHLIAGSDTTTTVLVFLLHHLAGHASLQTELHASLSRHEDRLEADPVLDAVLKEALRLWAPIPMTLPRQLDDDRLVGGYSLKKGTKVGCQAYTLHRLPHLFPDSETFDHRRWLPTDDDDDDKEETRRLREAALWAFSSGTRVCIGKALAMLEMKLLVGRLLLARRLSPGTGMRRELEMVEHVETFVAGPGHQADIFIRFESRLYDVVA